MNEAISFLELDDDEIIRYACHVLEERLKYRADREAGFTSPDEAKTLVQLLLADKLSEVFVAFFLDNRHRLIAYEELFHGTIDGASVHPREVVRAALKHNAAALIIAHNHPSGIPEPSSADKAITRRLKEALALIDVRVIDHLVVGDGVVSFAELGLL